MYVIFKKFFKKFFVPNTLFHERCKMSELWAPIEEFPLYSVSNFGKVVNSETNRIMRFSYTRTGDAKIALTGGSERHTRLVRVVVARAFVERMNEMHNTVVLLDNDRCNLNASNLIWRPRYYAWEYSAQFRGTFPLSVKRPIQDVDTERIYISVKDAAIANGILAADVYLSAKHGKRTKVTRHLFKWID
jgi:hypothetical protein